MSSLPSQMNMSSFHSVSPPNSAIFSINSNFGTTPTHKNAPNTTTTTNKTSPSKYRKYGRLYLSAFLILLACLCTAPMVYMSFFVDLRTCKSKPLPTMPRYPPALRRFIDSAMHHFSNSRRNLGTIRKMGPWDMNVSIAANSFLPVYDSTTALTSNSTGEKHVFTTSMPSPASNSSLPKHPRHFIYESKTTGDSFRLPLPVVLDDGDRGGWVSREKPFGGCRSIDNNTCKYAGTKFGSTMSVHTFASLSRTPNTPCVDVDFAEDGVHYHNITRIINSSSSSVEGEENILLDNGVDDFRISEGPSASCMDATLVPLFVPQGAYFAHFMNGAFPRLAVALAHREARGDQHEPIHIILLSGYKSDDTVRTLEAIPNVTVTFAQRVPLGVCYKRLVSVCYDTPGFDPRIGTELNRVVRNAFFDEKRMPAEDFETTMQTIYNANVDERHYRHALVDNANPLQASSLCKTRVYAGRKKGNRNGRNTPNENEIIQHLQTVYNFTVFEGGESLEDWAAAMKDACVFVGAHGGAMSHLFWLNPDLNPAVIEFDGYNKYSVFWYLAASIGFNFGWMGFNRNVGVDLDRLDALLAKFGVLPSDGRNHPIIPLGVAQNHQPVTATSDHPPHGPYLGNRPEFHNPHHAHVLLDESDSDLNEKLPKHFAKYNIYPGNRPEFHKPYHAHVLGRF